MARKAKPSPLEHKNNRKKCRKWRLYISIGYDADGNRIKTSRRFEGTETEAQAEIDRLEAELRIPSPNKMTLGSFCDQWLERRKGLVASSTFAKNLRDVSNFKYLFGEKTLLREISPITVEDAFNEMLTKGGRRGKPCRPSYVGGQMTAFSVIMNDAVRRGLIRENPVNLVKRVKVRSAQRDVPTPEELQRILSQLDVRDGRQMVPFLTGSMGLRRGEALGLNWGDVDFEKRIVHVHRVYRQTGELADETKTDSGTRDLPFPEWIAGYFRIREARAKEDTEAAMKYRSKEKFEWKDRRDDCPVCSDDTGTRITPPAATKWWGNHRAHLGVSCSEHDLRHSYLTSLVLLGGDAVDPATLMAIAGHASPAVTLQIYSHANMSSKEGATEAIADKLNPANIPPEN